MTQITTLGALHDLLCRLVVGESCTLPYNVFELFFPPGEPDDGARGRAFDFARQHGCVIDNRTSAQEVIFKKQITNPPACP